MNRAWTISRAAGATALVASSLSCVTQDNVPVTPEDCDVNRGHCDGLASPPPPAARAAEEPANEAPPDAVTRAPSALKTIGRSSTRLTPAEIAARTLPSIVAVRAGHSLGTGFGVHADGWIATSLHVVAGAGAISVSFAHAGDRPVTAIVSMDADRDLAILQVEGPLPALPLAESDTAEVGEPVVAIGNPLGFEATVSNGLVSGLRAIRPSFTVLQISAPIAPGSSGGPILDEHGAVIGVATATARQGQNLNFAVPASYLRALMGTAKPMRLPEFAAATKALADAAPIPVRRAVPEHPLSLLDGCSPGDQRLLGRVLGEVNEAGAPLCDDGKVEACQHLYDGALVDLAAKLSGACKGPKRTLADAKARAGSATDAKGHAWALRDAFDGLRDVVRRKNEATAPR